MWRLLFWNLGFGFWIPGRKQRKAQNPKSKIQIPLGPEPTVLEALLSERPSDIFMRWALDREDRLRELLPDLAALRGVSQAPAHRDNAFIHTLKVVDAIAPTPTRRWAALLHDIGKGPTYIETPEGRSRFFEHDKVGAVMVPEIMSAVGEDPQLICDVQRLVGLHMRPISYLPEWSDAAVRRLAEDAEKGRGPEGWTDLMALARADLNGYLPEPIQRGIWVLDQLETRYNRLLEADHTQARKREQGPRSPLDGNEILTLLDHEPGPWVRELKNFLLEQVERGSLLQDDKATAARLANEWLAERDYD